MTDKLSDFVESWFFDSFCKTKDCKSREEFIDCVWGLYSYDNNADIDACIEAAEKSGIKARNSWHDISAC